jgi:hypothetical protein
MKTLQTEYNLIKEGKGFKDSFVKEAKRIYPNLIPNSSNFEQTSKILINKSIIFENQMSSQEDTSLNWFKIFNESITEAKVEEKSPTKEVVDMETRGFDYKDTKNIDNVYGQSFLDGFYTEMCESKNKDKSVEEIKNIVAKNLAKDRLYYVKDGQFGIKGLGYTTEHPGLGTPKEPKGKYKSSGYGDIDKKFLNENKSNPEVEKLLKIINTKKAGPEYKKALIDLISMAEKKSGKTINTKKEALLALDYIEPSIRELETRSVGSMVKPEGFQVGDKVKFKGMNHEVTRIVDDRIYIKNLKYSGRPDTWVKAVDLKENKIPQFKKGDKVTYLGYPGEITGVNNEMTGAISYNVAYNKGNGRTKASNIYNKGGAIKHLNDDLNESKRQVHPVVMQNMMENVKKDLYQISKSGPKSNPYYVLEKPDGSKLIDMMFDTYEDAEVYAKKKGFTTQKGLNENNRDFEGTGLIVIGRTQLDNNGITDMLDETDYYGIWDSREGYWFFPEDEETLDSLEIELSREFDRRGIDARFEGQFNESLNENKNNMIKLLDLLEGEYYDLPKKEDKKKIKKEEKKPTKKSPISDKIKEIEAQGSVAALEAKMNALEEEIQVRESKLNTITEDESLQEFINPTRVNEMEKEIKELKKAKEKYSKIYEKLTKAEKE